ncbi:hypothetical protein CHUAL_000543 [Chamberlinius hualienensis]
MDNISVMEAKMFPSAVELANVYGCDICGENHPPESCLQLGTTTIIVDSVVPSNAILTLPRNLRIKYPINKDEQDHRLPKITAREKINRGTRFGPLQAPLSINLPEGNQLIYKVMDEDGKSVYFDTSCTDNCNWMSLVLGATSKEQHNLIAYQIGQSIYFSVLRDIRVHEELRVWYAPFFAKKLGICTTLPSTGEETKIRRKYKSKSVTCDVEVDTNLQTELQGESSSNNTYQLRVRNKVKRKIYEDFVDITEEDKDYLEKESKDDQWTCSHCDESFNQQSFFAKHLLNHLKQQPSDVPTENHNCQFCQANFCDIISLQQHYIDQHRENFVAEQGEIQTLDDNISDADAATILLAMEANCDKNEEQQILDDGSSIGDLLTIQLHTCEENIVASNKIVENSIRSSSFSCEICKQTFCDQNELVIHIRQHVDDSDEKLEQDGDENDGQQYSCSFCQKIFSNKFSLKIHQDRHTGTYSCFECGCSFTSKETLNEHSCSFSKNNENNFTCQICQKAFTKLKYLEKHIPVHTGINACPICGKWLRSSESLVNHLRICGQSIKDLENGGYAVCMLCKETFLTLKDYRQHMFQHRHAFVCSHCGARFRNKLSLDNHACNEISHLECDICNSKFSDVASFNQHLSSVHRGESLKCDQCNSTFSQKELLENHQCAAVPHKKIRKNKSLDPLVCSTCGALFSSTSSLNIHKRLHGDKLFSCEVCGKRFHRKDLMLDHWSVHADPTIPCAICNKKFKTKKSLDVHMAIHDGLKRYSCEICGKKFYQKGNLLKHIDVHNPTRKYSCEHCPKSFTTKEYLAIHVMEHTKGKQHSCEICNKSFIKDHQLKAHQRLFHANIAFTCSFCGLNVKFKHSLKRHLQKKHMEKQELWSTSEQLDHMMVSVAQNQETNAEEEEKPENEDDDDKTEVVLAVSGIGSEALQQALVSGAAKIKHGSTPNIIEITLPSQDVNEELGNMQNESQLATTHIIQLPFTDENENEQTMEEAVGHEEDESKQQIEIIVTSDIGTPITLDNEEQQLLAGKTVKLLLVVIRLSSKF